jgi:hypothetical protein
VTLRQAGEVRARTRTDAFGEFRFDGLAPHSGEYEVEITHPVRGAAVASATLGESVNLGEICL